MNTRIPRQQDNTTIMENSVFCGIRAEDKLGAGVNEEMVGDLISL
jgi:hypothetical protein